MTPQHEVAAQPAKIEARAAPSTTDDQEREKLDLVRAQTRCRLALQNDDLVQAAMQQTHIEPNTVFPLIEKATRFHTEDGEKVLTICFDRAAFAPGASRPEVRRVFALSCSGRDKPLARGITSEDALRRVRCDYTSSP